MAFTPSEIKANLSRPEYASFTAWFKLSENPNLPLLTDYLTGKTTSLQGIDASQQNGVFFLLIDLFQYPEAPTPNDNLLLDVLYHPGLHQHIQHHLHNWLTAYLVRRDEEKVLQAVLALFQKSGFSTADTFAFLLHNMQNLPEAFNIVGRTDSAIKRFFIQQLPPRIAYQRQHHSFYVSGEWNGLYFALIEEAQPQFVNDYLFYGLYRMHQPVTQQIITHKNGKYVPLIVQWIDGPSFSEQEWKATFHTALVLFESDPEAYRSVVTEASKAYLQDLVRFYVKDRWENTFFSKELKGHLAGSNSFRALAGYFLLPQEKAFVKEKVDDWFSRKLFVSFDVLRMLQHHLGEEALPYVKAGLQSTASGGGNDHYKKILQLLTEKFSPAAYLPIVWNLVTTKSRQVREALVRIVIANDSEAEDKAIALLKHKNADARQTGALILTSFGSPKAIEAVTELLDRETNDNARDIFLQIVKEGLPQQPDTAFLQRLIASAERRNKLTKPVEPWLDESSLPLLYYRLGEALTQKELRFLLYRMSRVKGMRSETEANYLLQHIDKETASEFSKTLIDNFISSGTKPEHKYLLALAALLGNEDVVDRIRALINRWIDEGRLKMAEYGVGALALQGSDKALRWVEWYSRKYKTKKANVGAAALQALEDAAEEQGITVHELGDKVVPDFGFDGLYKTFRVNGDDYRAFIDSRFKLCFFTEEGKALKALPAAASAELKEEFKQVGKEVRDVVRSQSGRMEYYLLMQRKWTVENWTAFFLTNPVMFIYATKILWGVYNSEGALLRCFLCMEDTTLVDVTDDEIELHESSWVGIVHPLLLSGEQLAAWKRKFFDLSIEPVFPQLERLVYKAPPEDAHRKIVQEFAGKETAPNAIKPVLERAGWRTGGAGDGGYIDSFHLTDNANNTVAVLEVEGVFVGFGYDHEPKLGKLYFIDLAKQPNKWIQSPTDENDGRLLALNRLSPVFYSEVMYNIRSIKLKNVEAVGS